MAEANSPAAGSETLVALSRTPNGETPTLDGMNPVWALGRPKHFTE